MSGAAVEPGLVVATAAFSHQTGTRVTIAYATTPEIRRRFGEGETPDVVIAPPALLDELARNRKADGAVRVSLGRVGVGVVIRSGAPKPDISSTEALKRAVLDADAIIYNKASSGLYVEGLLRRLGLADQIQGKTRRYGGTDMIEPLIKGQGKEIGFMPIAQILHCHDRGLRLVGPLPADIQNYTIYAAESVSKSEAARAFVRFLGASQSKAIFRAAGVE